MAAESGDINNCALVISCSDLEPDILIKQIMGVDELPASRSIVEDIVAFDWTISNKYYTANVQLCRAVSRTIGNEEFSDALQAVIVHFDNTKTESFNKVKMWLPYLMPSEPDIQLLVCDNSSTTAETDDSVSRDSLQEWCIDNAFELIELNPSPDLYEEDESFGIKRIIQALHAHTWPDMDLKTSQCQLGEQSLQVENLEEKIIKMTLNSATAGAVSCNADDQNTEHKTSEPDASSFTFTESERDLFQMLGNEDPGGESFESLFSRMQDMKDKAARLPPEQRKKYAESVVLEFWKAVGGDPSEVDGLDDD